MNIWDYIIGGMISLLSCLTVIIGSFENDYICICLGGLFTWFTFAIGFHLGFEKNRKGEK